LPIIATFLAGKALTPLAVIFVFGVLIFVHELGHFILAKRNGVKVEVFSLGMGPKLVGVMLGETSYRISGIPFGGYVKMSGEQEDEEPGGAGPYPAHDFRAKSPGQRARIVFAGAAVNYLLGLILFCITPMLGYEALLPRVGGFTDDSAAREAGLLVGDLITAVDGRPVRYFTELQEIVQKSRGEDMQLLVERDGEELTFVIAPTRRGAVDDLEKLEYGDQGPLLLGVHIPAYEEGNTVFVKASPGESVVDGVKRTLAISRLTFVTVWKLISGQLSLRNAASGPVGIAAMTGEAAKAGLPTLLQMMAFISVSLAIFNLLPVPVLDGGMLVFLVIEALRRRPVSRNAQLHAQRVGLAFLLCLFAFITFHDLRRLADTRGWFGSGEPAASSEAVEDAGESGEAPAYEADE